MMWIIFGFIMLILGLVLVIIYLLNKLDELLMYKNEHEVRQLMIRLNGHKVSHDDEN